MAKPPELGKQKKLSDMTNDQYRAPRHIPQMGEVAQSDEAQNASGPEDDEDDPIVRVQVLGVGHFVNNHPLKVGYVIEMKLSDVEQHRAQGYQLGPVSDDYDGEIYDTKPEWQHPNNERVAAE